MRSGTDSKQHFNYFKHFKSEDDVSLLLGIGTQYIVSKICLNMMINHKLCTSSCKLSVILVIF